MLKYCQLRIFLGDKMNEIKEKKKMSIISYPGIEKDLACEPYDYNSTPKKEKHFGTKKIAFIISGSILGLILLAMLIIILINLHSKTIFSNIFIDGINVSNLSKEEAISKINEEKLALLSHKLSLTYENMSTEITGNDIDATYDIQKSVDEAYSIGRYGNILSNNINMIKTNFNETDLSCDYLYNNDKLNAILTSITSKLPQLQQPSYTINDNELIITKGKSGMVIDNDLVIQNIVKALQNGSTENIQLVAKVIEPEEINLTKIHNEIYVEPVNASYKFDPYEIIPHVTGVDFAISLEEVEAMLAEDKDEYIIPLVFIEPEITTDKIGSEAFPDLLASFETTYIQSKYNRTNNLKVASNSINGVVIMPGEVFSYNQTLGPRTVEAGYKMAGVYSGGKEVEGLGGGICQISSNLYNIAVMANLEIVERYNHQFLPGYVGAGRDATVVYGALDFKFRNNRKYPIKLESSVGNGYAKVKLFGLKEDDDYQVEFSTTILSTIYPQTIYEDTTSLAPGQTQVESYGQNGCKSITYKVLKKDGVEVSRVKLSEDTYSAKNKIILRGVETAAPVVSEPVNEPTENNDTPTTETTNTPEITEANPTSTDITIEI